MKEKLDKVQKKCHFKNYDLIQPQVVLMTIESFVRFFFITWPFRPLLEWRKSKGILEDSIPMESFPMRAFGTND
jgi:hypothetical protein